MAKVIKLDLEEVVISNGEAGIVRIPYEELDFKPELHDEVELYQDGDNLIVTKCKKNSDSIEDKIHINIVNENSQQQSNNNYVQAGKVVNKTVYIILAVFLGGLGAHKFYAGKTGSGIMYLIFCWTWIPSVLAIISAISAAFKKSDGNGNIIV
ncbi:TM2 domain-containing protein [Vagococcus entomophilus]|uniref:TM2 domain-containing protein n=1 Tax=Vagococcus entomophilus TaxID=1160095 RepID=A0A430AK62_9ENTE|nr:TM2 domain-containing protein [Vagococcus entomophilus]RSU08475.1 hypothetical protein CBF30_04345 [Vagococcus entomophilus]